MKMKMKINEILMIMCNEMIMKMIINEIMKW